MNITGETRTGETLLTIAIPTYNRSKYLGLCLKRIGEEAAGLSEEKRCLVKVYISDNASQDDTPQITSKFQREGLVETEVVRNIENIGADRNIAQCYESATSPYVWVIGDDDVILSGGLSKILDLLSTQDVDILYLNNIWFKDRYDERPLPPQVRGVSEFEAPLGFVRRTHVMLTFISAMVMRSGIGAEFRSDLLASNLVQLSWVLPLLRDGKRFAIYEDALIAAKGSNAGGYELVRVFAKNLKEVTGRILESKPELAMAIQNGTIVNFFPGFILELRNGSNKFADKNWVAGLKEAFSGNWRFYAILVPLIVLPLAAARFYNKLVFAFGRHFGSVLV